MIKNIIDALCYTTNGWKLNRRLLLILNNFYIKIIPIIVEVQ